MQRLDAKERLRAVKRLSRLREANTELPEEQRWDDHALVDRAMNEVRKGTVTETGEVRGDLPGV